MNNQTTMTDTESPIPLMRALAKALSTRDLETLEDIVEDELIEREYRLKMIMLESQLCERRIHNSP